MQDPSPLVISHLQELLSVAEKGIEINFQPLPAPKSRHLQKAGISSLHWEMELQSPRAWLQGCRVNGVMPGIQRLQVLVLFGLRTLQVCTTPSAAPSYYKHHLIYSIDRHYNAWLVYEVLHLIYNTPVMSH